MGGLQSDLFAVAFHKHQRLVKVILALLRKCRGENCAVCVRERTTTEIRDTSSESDTADSANKA